MKGRSAGSQWFSCAFLRPMRDAAGPRLTQLSESEPGFLRGCVALQLFSQKGPSWQARARRRRLLGKSLKGWGHPTVLENYRIPEDNAYLGQLLCVGQIVHGDGQEHVQQRV